MSKPIPHPGHFVRDRVLPSGMSVTEAAKLLDVGRPAFSNFLNGNAALSPDMAARLERAFSHSAQDLMDMQAAYDTALAKERGAATSARAYVPPFLQVTAKNIEDWADQIRARSRLSVLLRTLVNSTGIQITTCRFPGNDESEQPGWDGYVEAGEGTPWIPMGKSGWEFGVNIDPKAKANKDYLKSIQQNAEQCAQITFVFVTPRIWRDKGQWEKARRAEGRWKDVRVIDASVLEEWLEQSIAGQAWFAHETGIPTQGVLSIDACWDRWVADMAPSPSPALFSDNLDAARKVIANKFKSPGEPVTITADSKDEALGFLAAVLSSDCNELAPYRDRVAAFQDPATILKLVSKSANFIPIITNRETERAFAPYARDVRSIIVYSRNEIQGNADIALEPVSYDTFNSTLSGMGYGRDDIDRLSRESGRSPTVLRRRLSALDAVRRPEWSSNPDFGRKLVPLMLAGAWDSRNVGDRAALELLSLGANYQEIDHHIARILQLEDAPLWCVGSIRGVVSKIDALFSVKNFVVAKDLDAFFDVATLILSEDDPSLDVPEEKRLFVQKRREISETLRTSIDETLVLLSVYGNSLFPSCPEYDCELKARLLVRSLLTPISSRTLEAHSRDLPMYAEACPDEFLQLLASDLKSPEPESIKLMRPASTGMFGSCPRTGLLWALENTAWSPGTLLRTVDILAQLAAVPINDNWANKPIASLEAIFRCWMPQTAASIENRIDALNYLVRQHPRIGWRLCVDQFEGGHRTGHYNHKPSWRPDGRGCGEPVSRQEAHRFALAALDIALRWNDHNQDTLADLTANLQQLDEADQEKVWDFVYKWAESASDQEKAWFRDHLRRNTMSRWALKNVKKSIRTVAASVYNKLEPTNLILRHSWLFKKHWIDESADDLEDENFDYEKHQQRITNLRQEALKEVFDCHGIAGAIQLAESGEAADLVGQILPKIISSEPAIADTIRTLMAMSMNNASEVCRSMAAGLLIGMKEDQYKNTMDIIINNSDENMQISIFGISPFSRTTWDYITNYRPELHHTYWGNARTTWVNDDDRLVAVECLLSVNRPIAAFDAVSFSIKKLPAKLLARLMSAMRSSEETDTRALDSYRIAEALTHLDESGELSINEMAELELFYLDALDRREGNIPNLELQIEQNPDLFVQAIAFSFRRKDDGIDPEFLRAENEEVASRRAHKAYQLLDMLKRIPGHDRDGNLDARSLINWISNVRTGCTELARSAVGDIKIGNLLAKAPVGSDGIWPIEAVRDAIEATYSDDLARGVHTGLFNSRGVVSRAWNEGGEQERELAARYQNWAHGLEFSHPHVAMILTSMVRTYLHSADAEDTEDRVRRRLLR